MSREFLMLVPYHHLEGLARCGVPDYFAPETNHKHLRSLYSYLAGKPKWKKTNLKCHVGKNVPRSVTKFKFTYVKNSFLSKADILISFERWSRNCSDPSTPKAPSIAHSSPAPNGTVQFNADKKWASNKDKKAYDIQTVALHEFGHVLGLGHSHVRSSIMFPELTVGQIKGLYQDDIKGIKDLYGL